jgi:hypothetical protein
VDICGSLGCIPFPIPTYCEDKVWVIYEYNLDTIVLPLFGVCFVPYAGTTEAVAASPSVRLQQIGSEVAVGWDACQSKVTVDRCGVHSASFEHGCTVR